MYKFHIDTDRREQLVNITYKIQEIVSESGVKDGICVLFTLHTTCGLTITENADPDVKKDLLIGLDKISPKRIEYKHFEGNSPAHVKSSLIGTSLTLIVDNTHLMLGQWQGIYFAEFDGPRMGRQILVRIIPT